MEEMANQNDIQHKTVYERVVEFKQKYPFTLAWRLKKNADIVENHLNPGETVIYAFACQKNRNPLDFTSTAVVAITSERIVIGRKRVVFGYFFDSITPDLFNDLKVINGILWGRVYIDTVKEFVYLTNIDKRALSEIETNISSTMIKYKKENYRFKER